MVAQTFQPLVDATKPCVAGAGTLQTSSQPTALVGAQLAEGLVSPSEQSQQPLSIGPSIAQATGLSCQASEPAASGLALDATASSQSRVPGRCLYVQLWEYLRSLVWPPNPHPRNAVISCDSADSGYWNFGVRLSDHAALTSVTKALPHVAAHLNALLRQVWPQESWNALCVSHNAFSSPHRDSPPQTLQAHIISPSGSGITSKGVSGWRTPRATRQSSSQSLKNPCWAKW